MARAGIMNHEARRKHVAGKILDSVARSGVRVDLSHRLAFLSFLVKGDMNLHRFVIIHGGIQVCDQPSKANEFYYIYMSNALFEYSSHAPANSPEKSRSPHAIIITMPFPTRLNMCQSLNFT